MSNETWWYLTRAAGLTAWVFLTLTLVWGALISGRLVPTGRPRRWVNDLHPFLGGLGLAALVLHVIGAVADTTVGIGWIDAVVPFISPWNPFAIALGVLAVWCLVAVEVTSLLKRHLRRRTWHGIHLVSYAMAWLVTLHAAFAGTDVGRPVVAWTALGLVTVATVVGVVRALRVPPAPASPVPPVGPGPVSPVHGVRTGDAGRPVRQHLAQEERVAGGLLGEQGGGEPAEHLGDGHVQPGIGVLGSQVTVLADVAEHVVDRRHQPAQHGGVTSEHVHDVGGGRRAEPLRERLDEGGERRHLTVVEAAPQHGRPSVELELAVQLAPGRDRRTGWWCGGRPRSAPAPRPPGRWGPARGAPSAGAPRPARTGGRPGRG